MTKHNWNYEELGFTDEQAMNESIARVKRKMKLSGIELERENREEAQKSFTEHGGIDFIEMNKGVILDRLDQAVHQRILYEQEQAKIQAKREEMNKLMNSLGERTKEENEEKAQREMQKKQKDMEDKLQKEVYSKHNVKTDGQKKHDEALGSMLDQVLGG